MNDDIKFVLLFVGIIVLVFAFAIGAWVGGSYFEAQAFNRVTGKNVSTWDAMWLDLRVQENTEDKK